MHKYTQIQTDMCWRQTWRERCQKDIIFWILLKNIKITKLPTNNSQRIFTYTPCNILEIAVICSLTQVFFTIHKLFHKCLKYRQHLWNKFKAAIQYVWYKGLFDRRQWNIWLYNLLCLLKLIGMNINDGTEERRIISVRRYHICIDLHVFPFACSN